MTIFGSAALTEQYVRVSRIDDQAVIAPPGAIID
jgi:hypothetical protein